MMAYLELRNCSKHAKQRKSILFLRGEVIRHTKGLVERLVLGVRVLTLVEIIYACSHAHED